MTTTDSVLEWCDIKEPAQAMFSTWRDSGEVCWAKECWEHFRKAGLTAANDLLQENVAKVRLLALAWYYLDFCMLKWDEGYDEENRDVLCLAETLQLNPIALGIIATSVDSTALDGANDETELAEYAHLSAIRSVRREIYECLMQAYGDDAVLYARMCRTATAIDEPYDEDAAFEADGYNMQAYNFVQNGFQY